MTEAEYLQRREQLSEREIGFTIFSGITGLLAAAGAGLLIYSMITSGFDWTAFLLAVGLIGLFLVAIMYTIYGRRKNAAMWLLAIFMSY